MTFNITHFFSKIPHDKESEIEYLGEKCTLQIDGSKKPIVYVNVTSFQGFGFANHVYATLRVPRLICNSKLIRVYKEFKMDVKYPAPRLIKHGNKVDVTKGSLTSRFDSIESLIIAVESHFNQIFGEPWELQSYDNYFRYTDLETWETTKSLLRSIYGETDEL
jgi:hypothetical protein